GLTGYIVDDIEFGEPIFVIRGNDALALGFMRLYQTMTEDQFGQEKAYKLEHLIDYFRTWQQGHRELVKPAD
ncbi:hypothetical protein LCGC14_1164860, partial [marine sediment metagenome]